MNSPAFWRAADISTMLLKNSCQCCEERTATTAMMNSPAFRRAAGISANAAEEQLPLLWGENNHNFHDELSRELTSSRQICHDAEEQLSLLWGENSHNCHYELSCVLTSSKHICHAAEEQQLLLKNSSYCWRTAATAEEQQLLLKNSCHCCEERTATTAMMNSPAFWGVASISAMLLKNSCQCCEVRTTRTAMMNSCVLTSRKLIYHAVEEQLPLLRGESSHNCHDWTLLTSKRHICHAAEEQLPLLRGENSHICHAVWRFLRPICMCVCEGWPRYFISPLYLTWRRLAESYKKKK